VTGSLSEAQAVWRGAFLAHGSLTDPGRSAALEVTAPGNEVAMALIGVARRLGVVAKHREVRGVFRVVIRDGDAISAMLTKPNQTFCSMSFLICLAMVALTRTLKKANGRQ
jgi:DNA-binding protein WhiA